MKKRVLLLILSLCLLCTGCALNSDKGKISTTTDVLKINQDKYMFGMGELCSDVNGGGDPEVNTEFVAGNVAALGVKSMRVWMHLDTIIGRKPNSDEIYILKGVAEQYHTYIAELKKAGVERIVAMSHAFVYPNGFYNTSVNCVPDPAEDFDMYVRFLELIGNCYTLLATEFPEIDYWEPGNEYDMTSGMYLHKKGWTANGNDFFLTDSEAGRVTADICWYVNRAVQSVDKKNVVVLPGMTMSGGTTRSYLDETYKWIESKKLPSGLEYSDTNTWNYFQILSWHPYPGYAGIPKMTQECKDLYEVAKSHGDGNKKVWLTEVGFSEQRFGYDQEYVDGMFKGLFEAIRKDLTFIETIFIFRMSNCYTNPISEFEDNFGLFYAPGDPENRGKPKPYTINILKYFKGENADVSSLYWYSSKYGIEA